MNPKTLLYFSLFFSALLEAEITIPESYESAASFTPEAIQIATHCVPGTTESNYLQMAKDADPKILTSIAPPNPSDPYLLVNSITTYCIAMSDKKFPILPQEAFEETINFPDMGKEQQQQLRTSLARQIAMSGSATALLKNDKGNAFKVSYLIAANRPTKIYYRLAFFKPGEFDETKYETVIMYTGNVQQVSRGTPSEYVKLLFTK